MNIDEKLLREHNEGLALDSFNTRLAADPTFAAAQAALVAAEQAANLHTLNSINLIIPTRKGRRGAR